MRSVRATLAARGGRFGVSTGRAGQAVAGEFQYTVGRLLQLRARGLVPRVDRPIGDYHVVGPCRLTMEGRRVLQHTVPGSRDPGMTNSQAPAISPRSGTGSQL
jgi:hypothetical protein